MHVQSFADPAEFLAVASPLAAPNPPLFAFLHAWTAAIARIPPQRAFMAVVLDAQPAGFALQRDEGPLVLGACGERGAHAFADALAPSHPLLEGVTGTEAACRAFCRRWKSATGKLPRLRHRMRNHALTKLATRPVADGAMRSARDGDRDWLRAQLRAFAREAGMPASDTEVERMLRERIAEGSYRVWEADGDRRSFAGFSVAGPAASRIAPVYTAPASRRRGYAGALVGALCAELLAQRPNVFLVTDVLNATSNALYRRLGFEPLDETVHFAFVDAT